MPSLRPSTSPAACSACSAATVPPIAAAVSEPIRGEAWYDGWPGSGAISRARNQNAPVPAIVSS